MLLTSNSSTLKWNKDRQKSVKERRSGSRSHEIKRSRTRENNVLEDLEQNNAAAEENNYWNFNWYLLLGIYVVVVIDLQKTNTHKKLTYVLKYLQNILLTYCQLILYYLLVVVNY